MSQVAKLKELLFEPESAAIAKLSRRVEDVFDRVGTEARFEASVARTLDGALRAAEIEKHDDVATALAPLVVKTVKREISNSTDELVEALYPATGRMVKAYVANAIRELTDSINRRLEENPFMLRLTAWTSGRTPGELALADSQRLKVEDVLLFRRQTGELLGRWPVPAKGSNLDHVFGGVLTAINDLTTEAFKSQGSSLRELDLGGQKVYLRVSTNHLLAARCSGIDSGEAKAIFDDEFLRFVDRRRADLETAQTTAISGAEAPVTAALEDLGQRLGTRLQTIAPANVSLRRGMRPLTLLALLFGVPLAAWLAWGLYTRLADDQIFRTANGILEATPAMVGYPANIKAEGGGRTLTISGLAPSIETKGALLRKINAALPNVEVRDQLSAVPEGVDYKPAIAALRQDQSAFEAEIAKAAEVRTTARITGLLGRAAGVLQGEGALIGGSEAAPFAALSAETQKLSEAAHPKDGSWGAFVAAAMGLEKRIAAAAASTLEIGSPPVLDEQRREAVAGDDPIAAAERVAAAAQALADRGAMKRRLVRDTAALKADGDKLRSELAALRAQLGPPAKTSPRDALVAFARSNAVFFREATTLRDPVAAARALDELAALMAADGSLVRVVGYTDDAGAPARNLALSQQRAEAVVAELTRRGVSPSRLVALKRTSPEYNVSPSSGPGSANRRVEFEVGFVGEGGE